MTSLGASLDTVFVVTHTHWDREWYRTAEEFRPGLLDLVDEVLDGAAGGHFLLDGQVILLLDYLDSRPERAGDLAQALAAGRIDAGPWFVLGDNLIPSGEALVRNLLVGRDVLARLGGEAPRVLYCPDAFGHPHAMPRLAAGFALPLAVLWRGYGGAPWPAGDVARWRDDDGSSVLLHHLPPDGYEVGSSLPSDAHEAEARWARLRSVLAPRSTLGVVLLPNGADHHAVQRRRGAALDALAMAAAPTRVAVGRLQDFADEVQRRAAGRALPTVQGELRHSPEYAWSLQGTFGSRAAQKRRNARAERLLVHGVEPWLAMAARRDGVTALQTLDSLWRTLLSCHPHDTLCGCSIDAVAEAMDHRLGVVERAGALVARRARLAILGHDAAAAREREGEWRPVVTVWNALPHARAGIGEVEIDEVVGGVPVGPASAGATLPRRVVRSSRLGDGTVATQELSREFVHVREESPRDYPRDFLVQRRRVLAWLPAVEPLGIRVLPLHTGRSRPASPPHPVTASDHALDNGRCRIWLDDERRLCLTSAAGQTLTDVLALEVEGERGDLYTPSPIPGTRRPGTIVRHRCTARGPLRGELRLTMKAVVPARALTTATGGVIRHKATPVTVTVDVRLDADAEGVVLAVHGTNTAPDCRVRLVVRSAIGLPEVLADAAFGAVMRTYAADGGAPVAGAARECAVPTAPLHRYVSLYGTDRGVTVASDGLAEYEARPDGSVAVTLVRAVGELSRHDLPERPGHAGWPAATPGAQCAGPYQACLAILPHGPRGEAVRARVEAWVQGFLLPLVGETWRSAIDPPAAVSGPSLTGEGLAFLACKPGTDGRSLVVRCLNLLDRPVDGRWQLTGLREARLARLDETAVGILPVTAGGVDFSAPPHATVTILLRA